MDVMKYELSSFGALLKAFRKRRHLTQQQLASAVGVHRSAIIRWEQGDFLPQSKAIVLELAQHLHLDDQETHALLESSLTELSLHWHVPFQRNLFFTGREEILETLRTHLSTNHVVALTQSYALHGLGGVGKTQIALEYAYRHALEYSAVFWIGAETEEQVVSGLLRIAEVLQLPERDEKDQQRVVAAVQRWLLTHSQWLLIWDNVENLALLDRFLPPARSGAILITTRCRTLGTRARGMDLLPMEHEEGIVFLLRRAKVLGPEATGEQVQHIAVSRPADSAAVSELVTALGGLPLALDQAGAYLEATQCGLQSYLDFFRTRRSALLKLRGDGARDHPLSVSTTFALAITATAQRHPAVWDLLQVCALLQADAIPEELFLQGAPHLGTTLEVACRDPLEWERVVAIACSYSLLSRQQAEHTFSLHRLVQAVIGDGMTETKQEQWNRHVIGALEQMFPEEEYANWKQGERLLPHALLCLHRAGTAERSLVFASLAFKTAQYLRELGRYTQADPLYQQALHLREQILGPDHPDVALVFNCLGVLYWRQGRYEQAEALLQRALRIREQTLGPDHLHVADSLLSLGLLYDDQGEYAQAEALHQKALYIREQALGPDHPQVALPLLNLGNLYMEQGKYEQAESVLERVLGIWEHTLGFDHLNIAIALLNLGDLYVKEGKYEQAEALFQRALSIREQILGPDHPRVAHLLNNLGDLYVKEGKYEQAEALFQRAWQSSEQVLGPHHPYVAYPLTSLGTLSVKQGKYEQAEALFQRALCIREQTLGQKHLLVAELLHGLANLHREQGEYEQAEALFQRALQIRECALSPDHPDVAESLSSLALLSQDLGNYTEAERLYQRALSIREQHLGQQHPETAQTLYDLAVLRQKQGHLGEALTMAQRALSIRSQSLGDAHPKTVTTQALYAQLLQQQAGTQKEVASVACSKGTLDPHRKVCRAEEASRALPETVDPSYSENDPLQAFLDACCELHPCAWCRSSDLWQAYLQWGEAHQERYPLSRGAFIAQLKAHGCRANRTMTARIWRGIALVKKEA